VKRVLSVKGRELSAISFQLSAPEREQKAAEDTTEDRELKMEDRNTKGEINRGFSPINADWDIFTAETQSAQRQRQKILNRRLTQTGEQQSAWRIVQSVKKCWPQMDIEK